MAAVVQTNASNSFVGERPTTDFTRRDVHRICPPTDANTVVGAGNNVGTAGEKSGSKANIINPNTVSPYQKSSALAAGCRSRKRKTKTPAPPANVLNNTNRNNKTLDTRSLSNTVRSANVAGDGPNKQARAADTQIAPLTKYRLLCPDSDSDSSSSSEEEDDDASRNMFRLRLSTTSILPLPSKNEEDHTRAQAQTQTQAQAPIQAPTQTPTQAPTQTPTQAHVQTQTQTQVPTQTKQSSLPSLDAWPQHGGHTLKLLTRLVPLIVAQPSADLPTTAYQKKMASRLSPQIYHAMFYRRGGNIDIVGDDGAGDVVGGCTGDDTGLLLQLHRVHDTLETVANFLNRTLDLNPTMIANTFAQAHCYGVLSPLIFRTRVATVRSPPIDGETCTTGSFHTPPLVLPAVVNNAYVGEHLYEHNHTWHSRGPSFVIGGGQNPNLRTSHNLYSSGGVHMVPPRSNLVPSTPSPPGIQRHQHQPQLQSQNNLRDNQHAALGIPTNNHASHHASATYSQYQQTPHASTSDSNLNNTSPPPQPHHTLADMGALLSLLLFWLEQLMHHHPYAYGLIDSNDIAQHVKAPRGASPSSLPKSANGHQTNETPMDHQCGLWRMLILYHRFISTHFVDIMSQTLALMVGHRDLNLHHTPTGVDDDRRHNHVPRIDVLSAFHQGNIRSTPTWVSFRGIQHQRLLLPETFAHHLGQFARNEMLGALVAAPFDPASEKVAVQVHSSQSTLSDTTQMHIDTHRLLQNTPSYTAYDSSVTSTLHRHLRIDIFGPSKIHVCGHGAFDQMMTTTKTTATTSHTNATSTEALSRAWHRIVKLQSAKKQLLRTSRDLCQRVVSENGVGDDDDISTWSPAFVDHCLAHMHDVHSDSSTLPVSALLYSDENTLQRLAEYAACYENVDAKKMAMIDVVVHSYHKVMFHRQLTQFQQQRQKQQRTIRARLHSNNGGDDRLHHYRLSHDTICKQTIGGDQHAVNTRMSPLHFYMQQEAPNMTIPLKMPTPSHNNCISRINTNGDDFADLVDNNAVGVSNVNNTTRDDPNNMSIDTCDTNTPTMTSSSSPRASVDGVVDDVEVSAHIPKTDRDHFLILSHNASTWYVSVD